MFCINLSFKFRDSKCLLFTKRVRSLLKVTVFVSFWLGPVKISNMAAEKLAFILLYLAIQPV